LVEDGVWRFGLAQENWGFRSEGVGISL
jgi:hypothetical protein